jgi:hypothetical protein
VSMASADDDHCVCGHVREAHTHFRRGYDCGVCGRQVCARFKAQAQAASSDSLNEIPPESRSQPA